MFDIRPRLMGGAGIALLMSMAAMPALAQNAWDAENFDLDVLIEAARSDPPLTVYDSTGKIVEIAEAFSQKYSLEATGVKVSTGGQIDQVMREGQSGNIVGSVVVIQDVPPGMAQLVPMGLMESWTPPDIGEFIPEEMQNPVIIVSSPNVWTYNTETYDSCPISNIWELTEEPWHRKVAMQDPLGKPTYTDWFNQMEMHFDEAIADAYQSHYGFALETGEESATKAWVKALAANAPLLTDSDSAAGDAVGARGQADPFVGLMATAKFRDNAPEGLALGLCEGVEPFSGWMYPGIGMISTQTASPNAARLFVRYLLTEEGISPQTIDGKFSSNSQVPAHPDEPSGVGDVLDQMMPYNTATAIDDFDTRQDWQDFWRMNYTR